MRRCLVPMVMSMMMSAVVVTGCGGDDDADPDTGGATADETGGSEEPTGADDVADVSGAGGTSGGEVEDPAPAGNARVSVDGLEIGFDQVLAGGCAIADDSIAFGFAAPDGVTTLGAGLNHADDAWIGSIAVNVPSPDGEGVIGYYPAPAEGATLEPGSVAVDGPSMSYVGPMLKQPPNDGSNPAPVEVGDGTISATC